MVDLDYSRVGAGTLEWKREGALLLITVRQPPRREQWRARWRTISAVVALGGLAVTVAASLIFGNAWVWKAMLIVATLYGVYFALLVLGFVTARRKLLIRVSRDKLLVDEFLDGPRSWQTRGTWEFHSVWTSGHGRAWDAGDILSVRATFSGGLAVKFRHKGMAGLDLVGYDPNDMRWAAEAINKELGLAAETPPPAPTTSLPQ